MQWANASHAGFCPPGVYPWLPANLDYLEGVNVADQEQDPGSLLNYYRKLLHLRQNTPAIMVGDYRLLHEPADKPAQESADVAADETLAYLRHSEENQQTCLVLLNFSARAHHLRFSLPVPAVQCLFSTHKRPGQVHLPGEIILAPFEVYIGERAS
jgi:alpha-glucosidase